MSVTYNRSSRRWEIDNQHSSVDDVVEYISVTESMLDRKEEELGKIARDRDFFKFTTIVVAATIVVMITILAVFSGFLTTSFVWLWGVLKMMAAIGVGIIGLLLVLGIATGVLYVLWRFARPLVAWVLRKFRNIFFNTETPSGGVK